MHTDAVQAAGMEDLNTLGYADEMGRDELPLSERMRERKRAEMKND